MDGQTQNWVAPKFEKCQFRAKEHAGACSLSLFAARRTLIRELRETGKNRPYVAYDMHLHI